MPSMNEKRPFHCSYLLVCERVTLGGLHSRQCTVWVPRRILHAEPDLPQGGKAVLILICPSRPSPLLPSFLAICPTTRRSLLLAFAGFAPSLWPAISLKTMLAHGQSVHNPDPTRPQQIPVIKS